MPGVVPTLSTSAAPAAVVELQSLELLERLEPGIQGTGTQASKGTQSAGRRVPPGPE